VSIKNNVLTIKINKDITENSIIYMLMQLASTYKLTLHTLHQLEANLNLLWKWFSSKGFMQISKSHQIHHDSQVGGQVSCSAINLACKKAATFNIIWLACHIGLEISNDTANWFDHMIKTCQNLSCHQHSMDTLTWNFILRPLCSATTSNIHLGYWMNAMITQRNTHGMALAKVQEMWPPDGSSLLTVLS